MFLIFHFTILLFLSLKFIKINVRGNFYCNYSELSIFIVEKKDLLLAKRKRFREKFFAPSNKDILSQRMF